jgi:O-antigen/teichoic acid export membrane protein
VTAMTIAAIVAGLSDLGLTALGLRELSVRDPRGRVRLMSNLLGLRVALTLVGIVGSVLFSVIVGYRPVLVAGVALAGGGLMLQTVQGTLALSLMSRLRLGLLTATEIGRQALTTALTIVLVALGAGLLSFIGLAIPVGVLLLAVTAWLVRGEVPLLPRFDRAERRLLIRAVLPYSVAAAISVIYFRLSVVVVSLTADTTQLSYFGASFRILEVLILIPGLMVTGVFPIFARSALDDQERLAYAVSRVFLVALIVGVGFALVIAIGAPIAIEVVGGAEFAKATGVLRIQGIGLAGSFVSSVWGLTLLSLRRNRAVVLVNVAGLLVGTVLVLLLTLSYGASGAAAGTAITEVLLAALIPFVLRRTDPHIVPSMRDVPRVLLAGALAGAVVLVPGLPTLAAVAAAAVVYILLLLLMRAIPDELLVELRSLRASARGGLGTP